jgi:drug/metabolite transporter (DMT)-like permease
VVYLLATASAFFYGLASVMQHREAAAAPKSASMRFSLLTYLIRRPVWAAGIAADAAAFALHAAALGRGPLALVQPLLVTGLLFALLLAAAWERTRLNRWEWLGVLALTTGLAVLLSVSSPAEGQLVVPFARWIIAGGGLGVVTLILVAWARKASPRLKPILLGVGAAVAFAATDSLLKSTVDVLQAKGILEVIDGWYLYGLLVVGLFATLLVQSAFQAGPLALSLPALTAVEPLASSALGVILFREAIRSDPLSLVVELAAGALILFGIWVLARSERVTGGRGERARDARTQTGSSDATLRT